VVFNLGYAKISQGVRKLKEYTVLKFMLYYNWILNIDDKKLHENTAEASEYIICKRIYIISYKHDLGLATGDPDIRAFDLGTPFLCLPPTLCHSYLGG
jgi:hypothetical protein